MSQTPSRVRVPDLIKRKKSGEKICVLTAYDATMARLLDQAGIDVLLVGDSLGMVIQGYDTTIPVTLEAVIHHSRAVANGARRSLVVADMPFLTFQVSPDEAVRNAGRLVQEGGAAAVKMEGGAARAETVRRVVDAGIPVMGHVGFTPQAIHRIGGFRSVGKTEREAEDLLRDARALEEAGAFSVVLECIPAAVARSITAEIAIPTIGIGAGPHCDGQVLVSYDVFGLYDQLTPRYVKQYAKLGAEMVAAAKEYIADVQQGRFPAAEQAAGRS